MSNKLITEDDNLNNNENKQEARKIIYIFLAFLGFVLGVGGYFIINNRSDNTKNSDPMEVIENEEDLNKKEDNTDVSNAKTLTDELAIKDIDYAIKIVKVGIDGTSFINNDIYNNDSYTITDIKEESFLLSESKIIYDLVKEDNKYKSEEIRNKDITFLKDKLESAIKAYNYDEEKANFEISRSLEKVDADLVINKFDNIFGAGTFNTKGINGSNCPGFYYNMNTNNFVSALSMCGDIQGPRSRNYEIEESKKYIVKDNKVFVDVNVIYGILQLDDNLKYYNDRETTSENLNVNFEDNDIKLDDYSMTTKYRYTFEKNENGTYRFVQLEQVK